MNGLFSLLTVFCACLLLADAAFPCNINVKFRSKTSKRVKVDLIVPSLEIKSEPMIFDGKDQNKKVLVKGDNCETKHWIIRAFKEDEDGNWKLAKKIQTKMWGTGWIRVIIQDDYTIYVEDREGVAFSEGIYSR